MSSYSEGYIALNGVWNPETLAYRSKRMLAFAHKGEYANSTWRRTDVIGMPHTQAEPPTRPTLALRVGISGARSLREDQIGRIQREMDSILTLIAEEMRARAVSSWVARFYEGTYDKACPFQLKMLSPLAKGADRLAAKCAVAAGYELYSPLPFAKEEYEKDFTGRSSDHSEEQPLTAAEDLQEFRDLLCLAKGSFTLDGGRTRSENSGDDPLAARSYEYVGRFVVRHCDLLIAVWDGAAGKGRGGTADIVHYAAVAGVPVWWIHAVDEIAPAWIGNLQDLRDPNVPPQSAPGCLSDYLDRLILPPRAVHRHLHHNWVARTISRFREKHVLPAAEYFEEKPLKSRFLWKSYSILMRLASQVKLTRSHTRQPDEPVGHYWFSQYRCADYLATQYAARYRSSYVLVIAFTLCALILGAFAVGLSLVAASVPEIPSASCKPMSSTSVFVEAHRLLIRHTALSMAIAELFALVSVLAIVGASFRFDWHERSIEYRLLAELFRKQQTLSSLGWALSIGNIQEQLTDTQRLSWISWLFAAAKRAAPLPRDGVADEDARAASQMVLKCLIEEQLAYHRGRERMALNAGAAFEKIGGIAFLILLVCVAIKVFIEVVSQVMGPGSSLESATFLLGLSGLVLPGVSAAFVGIRSYAELQLLAEQSRHMVGELKPALARVARLDLTRPLVSQDMGAEAVTVATLMLQDLEGWGRLFRGKSMEG